MTTHVRSYTCERAWTKRQE